MLRFLGEPIRAVLRWQVLATAAIVLAGGLLAGSNGALSAALGGLISVLAGLASAVVATSGRAASAGGMLGRALLAEAVKIGLIVALLGMVLLTYSEVVVPAFLGSFICTILIFSMAFFVREHRSN